MSQGEVESVVELPPSSTGQQLGGVLQRMGGGTQIAHLSGILVDAFGNEVGGAVASALGTILDVQVRQLTVLCMLLSTMDNNFNPDDFMLED